MSIFTNYRFSEIRGHIAGYSIPRELTNNNRHLSFTGTGDLVYKTLVKLKGTTYLVQITVMDENSATFHKNGYYGNFDLKFLYVYYDNSAFKSPSKLRYNFYIGESTTAIYYIKNNTNYSTCSYVWPFTLEINANGIVFLEEKDNLSYNTFISFFGNIPLYLVLDVYYMN